MLVGERVELQLFTTLQCNLSCRYCIEKDGGVRGSESVVTYSLEDLNTFVATQFHEKEFIVTFYGGEPLINSEFIYAVMDRYPFWRYQLQTNGTLLDRLNPEYARRFDSFLVSIDGRKKTTDSFRGAGTHDRVLSNIRKLRRQSEGHITARCTWASDHMTKSEFDDLLKDFDYVHFQFPHTNWIYSVEYVENTKAVLSELVSAFFQRDSLYKVVPIMGMVRNALFPSRARELYRGRTQCRVSSHLFNVLPSGKVVACPDFVYEDSMTHGDVRENLLQESPLQYHDAFPCESCEAFNVCRTNCVMGLHRAYVMKDEPYRRDIVKPTCDLIRYAVRAVDRHDMKAWYSRLSLRNRRELIGCDLYEYVEIMP